MRDNVRAIIELVEYVRDIQIAIIETCGYNYNPYEIVSPIRRQELKIKDKDLKELIKLYDEASNNLLFVLAKKEDGNDYTATHLSEAELGAVLGRSKKLDIAENKNPSLMQKFNSAPLKDTYPFLTNRSTILNQFCFYCAQPGTRDYVIFQSNLLRCWSIAVSVDTPEHLSEDKHLKPYRGRMQEVKYISDILEDNKRDIEALNIDSKTVFFGESIENFAPEVQENLISMFKNQFGRRYGLERHVDWAVSEMTNFFEGNKNLYISREQQEFIKAVLLDLTKPFFTRERAKDDKIPLNIAYMMHAYSELVEHGDILDGKHRKFKNNDNSKSRIMILISEDTSDKKPLLTPPAPDA